MAYFDVPTIIEIAELSEPFAVRDLLKGKLYSPRINPKLPIVIQLELAAVKWAYSQTPSYTDIQFTANYLYDLCGIYALRARNALNPGGTPITPVTPSDSDCTGIVKITAADFESDGKTVLRPDWAGKTIDIFWNNIALYIFEPDWSYVIGGGFRINNPSDFDANGNNSDVIMVVMVGCFTPGAIINPYQTPINQTINITGVDSYDLVWNASYLAAYGKGAFQVYQDTDGSGIYNPTGILPVADDEDNPTVYTFDGLGNFPTRIRIF